MHVDDGNGRAPEKQPGENARRSFEANRGGLQQLPMLKPGTQRPWSRPVRRAGNVLCNTSDEPFERGAALVHVHTLALRLVRRSGRLFPEPRGGRPPPFPGPRSRPRKKRPELSQYAAIPPWRLLGHDGGGGLAYLSLLEQRGDPARAQAHGLADTLARLPKAPAAAGSAATLDVLKQRRPLPPLEPPQAGLQNLRERLVAVSASRGGGEKQAVDQRS